MEFRQSGDFVFFVSEGGEETFMGLKKKKDLDVFEVNPSKDRV